MFVFSSDACKENDDILPPASSLLISFMEPLGYGIMYTEDIKYQVQCINAVALASLSVIISQTLLYCSRSAVLIQVGAPYSMLVKGVPLLEASNSQMFNKYRMLPSLLDF